MHIKLCQRTILLAGAVAAAAAVAQTPSESASAASNPTASQASDAALSQRGKRLYLRCVACHDATPTGAPKTGPHLQGILGRRVAAVDGYAYSAALKAQNFQWDVARLDAWLTQPAAVVPGTGMAFIGMPDAEERRALIAFLRTLK